MQSIKNKKNGPFYGTCNVLEFFIKHLLRSTVTLRCSPLIFEIIHSNILSTSFLILKSSLITNPVEPILMVSGFFFFLVKILFCLQTEREHIFVRPLVDPFWPHLRGIGLRVRKRSKSEMVRIPHRKCEVYWRPLGREYRYKVFGFPKYLLF